jgi:hypothetical protein
MTFARGVLLVSACVFAFFGAWAVAFPASQVSLVEVEVPTATARADVRTQYGGFTLGFAVFLFVCFVRREWTAVGLLASTCALGGFALTRPMAALLDSPVSATIYSLALAEGSGAILSAVGWWIAKRDTKS